MIAISSEDYFDFLCPNVDCESINFTSIGEFDGYSIVKCNECGEEFYVLYSYYSSIWRNDKPEIEVSKHPKLAKLEGKPIKK